MDRDLNAEGFDFQRLGLKPVRETDSEATSDDQYDSEEEQDSRKKRRRQRKLQGLDEEGSEMEEASQGSSDLSEFEEEKLKTKLAKSNVLADYSTAVKAIDPDTLQKGEFISKHGKIVRPDRNDERKKARVEKRKEIGEQDMRAFRERELLKEKMKNNNIIREVLKK